MPMHRSLLRRPSINPLVAIAALAVTASTPCLSLAAGTPSSLVQKFDAVVAASMRDGVVPGLAAALIVDGRIVYTKGFGATSVGNAEPVTDRTRFGIGSVTKTLTAAAILALQDEGKLALDDPASRYLPELSSARDPRARLLTVRQLLSGRGCVPDIFVGSDASATALESQAQRLMADARFDLQCVPGYGYVYPNFGAVLAGLIVQRVSQQPYEDYIEQRLFLPMGMRDSTLRYWQPEALGANHGHYRSVSGPARVGEGVMGRSVGPTGMASATIQDMASYAATLLAGGIAPNGKRVLSERAVNELFQSNGEAHSEIAAAVPGIETEYGLGWEINNAAGLRFIGKGGSTGVMSAYVALLRQHRAAVIFLANLVDYGKVQVVFNGLALLTGGTPKPYVTLPVANTPPQPAVAEPALFEQLPGHYDTLEYDLGGFSILQHDGRYSMTSIAGELDLVPDGDGFRTVSDLADFNGRVYTLKLTHGRAEIWQRDKKFAYRPLATPH